LKRLPSRSLNPYRKAYFATLLGIAGIAALYLVGLSWGPLLKLLSDSLLEALAGLLFISAFLLARRYSWDLRGLIPRIWVAASFSAMFLFTAITAWNVEAYLGGMDFPHPSMAEPLLFASLGFAIYALTQYVKVFREALNPKTSLLVYSAIAVAGLAVTALIAYPILTLNISLHGRLAMSTIILSEFVLLALSLMGIGIFLGGSFARAWLFLSLGITLLISGNLILFHAALVGVNSISLLGDMCLASGLALTALAFHVHRREL